jgi:hypothetical protein
MPQAFLPLFMQHSRSSSTHTLNGQLLDGAFMEKLPDFSPCYSYFNILVSTWINPNSVCTHFEELGG